MSRLTCACPSRTFGDKVQAQFQLGYCLATAFPLYVLAICGPRRIRTFDQAIISRLR